jgi:hypothetical protein
MVSRWILTLALTTGSACAHSSTGPSAVPSGLWGGDHVTMTAADTATHLEFDCAHGDIPGPLQSGSGGQFSANGSFVREHGGPSRSGEAPDLHPAAYTGSVMADSLTLTIRLTDSNEVVGTFTLVRGSSGRLVKCL